MKAILIFCAIFSFLLNKTLIHASNAEFSDITEFYTIVFGTAMCILVN